MVHLVLDLGCVWFRNEVEPRCDGSLEWDGRDGSSKLFGWPLS